MTIGYTPKFIRAYKKLLPALQTEVKLAIADFKNETRAERLRIHKLGGRMKGRWSFSVNYHIRIVFSYLDNDRALLLAVGDHNVYE